MKSTPTYYIYFRINSQISPEKNEHFINFLHVLSKQKFQTESNCFIDNQSFHAILEIHDYDFIDPGGIYDRNHRTLPLSVRQHSENNRRLRHGD